MTEKRYSSAFDALLKQNRKELDALLHNPTSLQQRPTSVATTTDSPRITEAATSRNPSEQSLTDRYGDRWKFATSGERREGNEWVVLGRLTLVDQNIVKSQFGSATIDGQARSLSGTADGVALRLASAGGTESAADRDRRTLADAREDALKKCISLL